MSATALPQAVEGSSMDKSKALFSQRSPRSNASSAGLGDEARQERPFDGY